MATGDMEGGYSNVAMDTQFDVDLKPPSNQDELPLRVDQLPAAHLGSGSKPEATGGPVQNAESEELDFGNASDLMGPNIRRDRPFSASMISHRSTASNRSRVSVSPSIRTSDYSCNKLFAHRPETLDKAFDDTASITIKPDRDGERKGSWLLTEIDHWDHEMERIVLLTKKSLLIAKYDLIKLKLVEAKQIPFACITKIQIGDLKYPPSSLMPTRDYGGIRIFYGSVDDVWFSQRWNPWSRTMPYVTLTHHMLAYHPDEAETVTYNADDLAESLVAEMEEFRRHAVADRRESEAALGDGAEVQEQEHEHVLVEDAPIVVESYASLMALIFNQSKLGFYLERGGVSF